MAKKAAKAAVKEVLGSVVSGELAFQRVGQGMASFKVISKQVLGNPLVQVPLSLLPSDYAPEKYAVTGTFEYRIDVKAK